MQTVRMNIFQVIDLLEMKGVDLSFLASNFYRKRLEGWERFQTEVKKQRKRLAKKYHPDVGGDGKRMQEINEIVDLIMKIKPAPPRPSGPVVIRIYGSFGGFQNGWYSTASTTTANDYW